jgi:hypothetical protein
MDVLASIDLQALRCRAVAMACSTSGRMRTLSHWPNRGIRIDQRKRYLPRTHASEDGEGSNIADAWERLLLTKRWGFPEVHQRDLRAYR